CWSRMRDFAKMLISVGRECATFKKCFKIIVADARFRKNVNFCWSRTRDDEKISSGRLRETATA
ncbi:MAG: hypothetical protein LBH61_05025, partial [Dysgonamonadaceae bacterium]|nr:hypothetical protein [Dysgonamonadaceae bacterium]